MNPYLTFFNAPSFYLNYISVFWNGPFCCNECWSVRASLSLLQPNKCRNHDLVLLELLDVFLPWGIHFFSIKTNCSQIDASEFKWSGTLLTQNHNLQILGIEPRLSVAWIPVPKYLSLILETSSVVSINLFCFNLSLLAFSSDLILLFGICLT